MRFAIKIGLCFAFALASQASSGSELRDQVLRDAALKAGLIEAEKTHVKVEPEFVAAGKLVFQSKRLSLNRETACASCHLDRFGSADGIPNAVGTQGKGQGVERLAAGGDIIPRNTLPFWGRGGVGFNVFFWDGKVNGTDGAVVSQFGPLPPSSDPLVAAAHLPPVEIGEMITDSQKNDELKTETISTAQSVYALLVGQLIGDPDIEQALTFATGKQPSQIVYLDVATALASFIRENFKVQPTKLHRFVFEGIPLTDQERRGGLVFYGKGGCSICHNGAYFTDFDFHAVPFPQAGFGKNGFGIDYGRFNETLDPDDRYKFRTPPLLNVTKTAPYSHSGSVADLGDAIRFHVDPLALYNATRFSDAQRVEYYSALKSWSREPLVGIALDNEEIDDLVAFLATLEYDSATQVEETD